MSHAAVLLAGGKSSRMGSDKSALPVGGEPLWQRQLATLRATDPAELFISGKNDGPYANAGVEILVDKFPDSGPLGGIATALLRCKSEHLLVLAVDMPAMTAAFLRTLLGQAQCEGKGVVPVLTTDGMLEPLAAVYPAAALAVAEECLRAGHRKLETFIRALQSQALVRISVVEAEKADVFMNWNTPGDIASAGK